jgi:hypothetical protein
LGLGIVDDDVAVGRADHDILPVGGHAELVGVRGALVQLVLELLQLLESARIVYANCVIPIGQLSKAGHTFR